MSKRLKVLFISGELIAGDLAYRLKKEGCDIRLYIEDKSRKDCLDGMIDKTDDWRKELEWVGRDGLIVFDDVGYGKIQDELRNKGYLVFGGNVEGDKLEKEREFAQEVFASCGIATVEKIKDFSSIESAIRYIKKNKGRWVLKQNAHEGSFAYVGQLESGDDVVGLLNNYKKYNDSDAINVVSLQKYVEGVEVAIARYFNGNDWASPIFINCEHKLFMNDDVGPLTAEMGTVGWYDDNEKNNLFLATLAKLKNYLQKINYKGYIDINSIVNAKQIIPLEATMRFGCPTNQLQSEIHLSPWKELLMSIAKGKRYNLKYKRGYSIVVSLAIPPFPYKSISSDYYLKDVEILFKDKLTENEINRIHFEEVSLKKVRSKKRYRIAGSNGYILYVTGTGKTVQEARKEAYGLIDKIVIPKMFYRTDIGLKFIERDENLLKEWGWI